MYSFFSFKLTKKGRYALIPVKAAETSGYRCDACTLSEGGSDYKRVYFQSPSDLDVFADYICKSFTKEQRNMRDYLQHHRAFGSEELETLTESWVDIDDETMNDYLNSSEKKDYSDVPVPEIEDVITINDVEINAVHNRCPFETIVVKEYSWDDNIFEKWRRGEELRQAGQHLEAIAVYEECRSDGLIVPYLYTGFAKAYHSLKDYDNEIVILEEGIKYFKKNAGGDLITKRDSAIKALYKKQQAERIAIQKKAEKEAKKQEKERADAEKKAEKQRLQQERAKGSFGW